MKKPISFTALYAAHAETCTAISQRDQVTTLTAAITDSTDVIGYPVSGDMLAVMQRGTRTARVTRRRVMRALAHSRKRPAA